MLAIAARPGITGGVPVSEGTHVGPLFDAAPTMSVD
jgi:hypothetical protein